jgi:hypothetical protein
LPRARSPTAPLIPVVFRVQYNTRLGQEILLVGSSPHLGEWSVANACTLRWTEGGVWTATLSLPAGAAATPSGPAAPAGARARRGAANRCSACAGFPAAPSPLLGSATPAVQPPRWALRRRRLR